MNSKPIIVAPKGCFSSTAMKDLRAAGYAVVVAHEPDKVRMLAGPSLLPLDKLSNIALEIINDKSVRDYSLREEFRKRVLQEALSAAGLLGEGGTFTKKPA